MNNKQVSAAALIVLALLLAYGPALDGPLFFDDKPTLTLNRLVQIEGTVADDWRAASYSSHAGPLRRPVTMFTFALNHALAGGFVPWQLKAVNLLIHLLSGLLIYLLAVQLLSYGRGDARAEGHCRAVALTAAALWLLHPLHVSTVLYVVQRMAQMSTLLVLLGLLVFANYRQRWARLGAGPGEVAAAALWLALITAAATLAKENGILLPWLVLALEVTLFRGMWGGREVPWLVRVGWVLFLVPLVLVTLAVLLDASFFTSGYRNRAFTLEERLLTQLRMLWHYLYWSLLPNASAMGFQHDDIPWSRGWLQPATTALAAVAWLGVLALAVCWRKRRPLLLFALLFYLVAHSMESSVLPLEMVYEHRNYLPSAGLFILVSAWLWESPLLARIKDRRVTVCTLLGLLSLLLFLRAQNWSDELTLFRVNLDNHPHSARTNYFYADANLARYRQRGQLGLSEEEADGLLLTARHYFERMHQEDPRDSAALVMLYYLDQAYFTQLQQQVDWLQKLEALLQSRVMQASDFSAMASLMDCFAVEACKLERAEVLQLVDGLIERYPTRVELYIFRYHYLVAVESDPQLLLAELDRAIEVSPTALELYFHAIRQYSRTGDIGGMYEAARRLLENDRKRWRLPIIKPLFAPPETAQ